VSGGGANLYRLAGPEQRIRRLNRPNFGGVLIVIAVDMARAFSSEVDTGSREENASKQEGRASVLIQSEPIML
jgi:hypothetical protein